MSSSDDDSSQDGPSQEISQEEFEEPDGDTLRVMISTDNHLGYLENDPIRGMDSFAAFEEVLHLAQARKVDCILLGGDLFHHNKPTRQTLHKTMEILRRYTMGPDPVKIQILSNQRRDFRGAGRVNYEDANYSVDLPIFSIHGNHDDPTRDGGKELLAALDLLAMSNLVNYFGRQDQVDKVEVSPVLIQKGSTKCALYGLGNMRDERLNRMWQRKKVLFLRPENAASEEKDNEEEEEVAEWFNIFVLHQNRDNMGRGNKNCIHESMIPNWMDLAIFGHEHTSEPHPAESVVGTFRITQPGSSVATSLSEGESERKHAIVLDIRGCQFKMDPIPLTQVRPCIIHDLSLQDHAHLDPEDPKVDQKITQVLEEILHTQMINAREKQKTLMQDAVEAGNYLGHKKSKPLRFQMVHGEQPLIRLRVEHSGFTTLNNQRFGAKFVGKVANPTDILLYQRAKKTRGGGGKGKGGSKKSASDALEDPVQPEELQAVSVEDLIKESLEESEQKLDILKQKDLALALEEFVDKSEGNAIPELTEHLIKRKQKDMMKEFRDSKLRKDKDESMDQEDSMMDDRDESFESTAASTQKRKRRDSLSDDDSIDKENQKSTSRSKGRAAPKKKASKTATIDISSADEDEEEEEAPKPTKGRARGGKRAAPNRSGSGDIRQWTQSSRNTQASQATSASSKRGRAAKKRQQQSDSDDGFDDSDVEVVSVKKSNSRSSPRRRTNKGKAKYADNDSDDDAEFVGDSSPEPEPVKKKRGRAAPKSSQRSGRGRKASQQDDSFDLDDDWGTAATRR